MDASGKVTAVSPPFRLVDAPSLAIARDTHPDSLDKGGTYRVEWKHTGDPFTVCERKYRETEE